MKRNTTPTLCISINIDKSKIKYLEFIFKEKNDPDFPQLLKKSYTAQNINAAEGINSGEFLYLIDFSADETMLLPAGKIYMDTRIVTNEDKILETEIISFDMKSTLFSEVYSDENIEG